MKNYLNPAFLKSKQNINMPITKALLKYDTPVIKDIYSEECKKLIEAFNNNSHIKKAIFVYDIYIWTL